MSLTQTSTSLELWELAQIPAPALTLVYSWSLWAWVFPTVKWGQPHRAMRALRKSLGISFHQTVPGLGVVPPPPPSHPSLVKPRKHVGLRIRRSWMWIPALLFTLCLILDKSRYLPAPHSQSGVIIAPGRDAPHMDWVSSHRLGPAWNRVLVSICFCFSPCASLRTGILSALQTSHSPPLCNGGAEAAITVTGLRGAHIHPLTNHKAASIISNGSTALVTEEGGGTYYLWGSPSWSHGSIASLTQWTWICTNSGGDSGEQRSLACCSAKNQTWLSD